MYFHGGTCLVWTQVCSVKSELLHQYIGTKPAALRFESVFPVCYHGTPSFKVMLRLLLMPLGLKQFHGFHGHFSSIIFFPMVNVITL